MCRSLTTGLTTAADDAQMKATMLPLLPLLLALLLPPAGAQVTMDGKCPAPAVQAGADATTAAAFAEVTWLEWARYYSWLEDSDHCATWKFTVKTASDTELVMESITDMRTKNGKSRTMKSEYTQKNAVSKNAQFYYKILEKPGSGSSVPGTYDYEIIYTDNEKAAVAWSCKDKSFGKHEEMLWILKSADAEMADVKAAIDAAQNTQGLSIDLNELFFVDQTDATCAP